MRKKQISTVSGNVEKCPRQTQSEEEAPTPVLLPQRSMRCYQFVVILCLCLSSKGDWYPDFRTQRGSKRAEIMPEKRVDNRKFVYISFNSTIIGNEL